MVSKISKLTKIGVSGLVFDMAPPGRILLIKREKNPYINKWAFPGGSLEYGESVEEGIKREVFEETGFKIFIPRQNFFHLNELIEKESHFIILSSYCIIDFDDLSKINDNLEKRVHNNIEHKFFYLDDRNDKKLPYFDDLKDEECIPNLKEIVHRFSERYIKHMGF